MSIPTLSDKDRKKRITNLKNQLERERARSPKKQDKKTIKNLEIQLFALERSTPQPTEPVPVEAEPTRPVFPDTPIPTEPILRPVDTGRIEREPVPVTPRTGAATQQDVTLALKNINGDVWLREGAD